MLKKAKGISELACAAAVLLFFCVPPITAGSYAEARAPDVWDFIYAVLQSALFFALSRAQSSFAPSFKPRRYLTRRLDEKALKRSALAACLSAAALFAIFAFSFLCLAAARLTGCAFNEVPPPVSVRPSAFLFAFVFASALREELLYRVYLPDILRRCGLPFLAAESCACALFALAHTSAGVFSVIHAALCACVLRALIRYANSAVPAAVVHAVYNSLVYIARWRAFCA